MKFGKNPKTDPNAPEFDYEEWRKSNGIKPAIEVKITLEKGEGEEEEENEMEDDEEEEPEEYKNFKAENGIKSVKEILAKRGKSI